MTSNVIIINNKQEVLLVKRTKGADAGNLWSLPGGTCEEGENKEDTLKREIQEELGFSVSSFSFFRSFEIVTSEKTVIANYFFGTIKGSIVINKIELSEYNWFNKSNIPTNLAFNQNTVLSKFWGNYSTLNKI